MASVLASHPVALGAEFEPVIGRSSVEVQHEATLGDTTATVTNKKKKKKRAKKPKPPSVVIPTRQAVAPEPKPPVLCISRNKHWKYISSYHGPWLQLPIELLESLLALNMDPTNFMSRDERIPPLPNGRRAANPLNALAVRQLGAKPMPPPIDPGVFRSVTSIRRLIDEASDLAVRAASGLSAAALRSPLSNNGPWAAAQAFGINPLGDQNQGRSISMSSTRAHRLRVLAVQKLAEAYKYDEIAASVMVMQGATALDDLAERVLKVDPTDLDARYVHFFHEKIPSRQLAESTTTRVLDELIEAQPNRLHYFRTRGIVRCFRDEYALAIKDFSHALKESRMVRRAKATHHSDDNRHSKSKSKKRGEPNGNGQAPASGTSVMDGNDSPRPLSAQVHPSVGPDAPEPLEPQALFLRAAAYLQHAVFLIERIVLRVEGVEKMPAQDALELKLSLMERGKFGGVSSEGPNGPLGPINNPKFQAYRQALSIPHLNETVASLLKKSIRDHEKFMTYFDTVNGTLPTFEGNIAQRIETAFILSESLRPGSQSSPPPLPENPGIFTTYHPLLVESQFSVLICHLLLGDFTSVLPAYQRAASLIDGLEGYPVFLPARSIAQAEFIEILERLATTWGPGTQPHSLLRKNVLCIEAPPSAESPITPIESNPQSSAGTRTASPTIEDDVRSLSSGPAFASAILSPNSTGHASDRNSEAIQKCQVSSNDMLLHHSVQGNASYANALNLDSLRILLAPVANRQRERVQKEFEEASSTQREGGKRRNGAPVNIPLHGTRVDIALIYIAAVHLPELDR